MEHPDFHKALSKAGIASMGGGSRKSANNTLRSRRQRRKGYDAEATALVLAYIRSRPGFQLPDTDQEIASLSQVDPTFRTLCQRMDGLAAKWGV